MTTDITDGYSYTLPVHLRPNTIVCVWCYPLGDGAILRQVMHPDGRVLVQREKLGRQLGGTTPVDSAAEATDVAVLEVGKTLM